MKMIFTDLDGSLLDHDTYSFEPAAEALQEIKEARVPLILCSSKTVREMDLYRRRLGLNTPFIAENGGGVCFPEGSRSIAPEDAVDDGEYKVVKLGEDLSHLRSVLDEVREVLGVRLSSFGDMEVAEVMELTSLREEEAMLAMDRRFTEPFVLAEDDRNSAAEIVAECEKRGVRVVKGGRFYHLMGQADKGAAVRRLIDIYSEKFGEEMLSLGLGDSENDLEMLSAVNRAVLVRRYDGSWLDAEGTEGFQRTEGIGPAGWNGAVLSFLKVS